MGLLIGWGQEDRDPLESRLGICRLSVALVQLLLSATDKTVCHALIDKQGKRLVENYAKGGGFPRGEAYICNAKVYSELSAYANLI